MYLPFTLSFLLLVFLLLFPSSFLLLSHPTLGESYVTPKPPATFLTEAAAWCTAVLPQALACDPDTLVLMTEVMLRRGRFLQAIRCLHCGLTRTPHHPGLSVMLVKFAAKVGGGASNAGASSPP